MPGSPCFFEELFEPDQLRWRKKVTKLFSETDLLVIEDLFLRKSIRALKKHLSA
jgi:hypothetical protein